MVTQFSSTPRNSNLELYRIIVMLLIVAHHSVYHSGILETMKENPSSANSIWFYILGMWGKTGINCFVLITGYFMCKSHMKFRKLLKLLLEIEFYNVLIYVIFLIAGKQDFSIKSFYNTIAPFREVQENFAGCFLVFYLCIPFLSTLVNNLGRRQHLLLVLLGLGIYAIPGTLPGFIVKMNYLSWFCVLFFVASYLRNYGQTLRLGNFRWGMLTLVSVALSILSVMLAVYANEYWGGKLSVYHYVNVNTFFSVFTAVSSFMYFKGLKIQQHAWINTIAAGTFGVYLIHDNSNVMREWLWRDFLDYSSLLGSNHAIVCSMALVVGIFMSCFLIDAIRIRLFENNIFKWIDKLSICKQQ